MKLSDLHIGNEYAVVLHSGPQKIFDNLIVQASFGLPGWNGANNDQWVTRATVTDMRVSVKDSVSFSQVQNGIKLTDSNGKVIESQARYVIEPWSRFQARVLLAESQRKAAMAPWHQAAQQLGRSLQVYSSGSDAAYTLEKTTEADLQPIAEVLNPDHADQIPAAIQQLRHLHAGLSLPWGRGTSVLDNIAAGIVRNAITFRAKIPLVGPCTVVQLSQDELHAILTKLAESQGVSIDIEGFSGMLKQARQGIAVDEYREAVRDRLNRRDYGSTVVVPMEAQDSSWDNPSIAYKLSFYDGPSAILRLEVENLRWTIQHDGCLADDFVTPEVHTLVDFSNNPVNLTTLQSLVSMPGNAAVEWFEQRLHKQTNAV